MYNTRGNVRDTPATLFRSIPLNDPLRLFQWSVADAAVIDTLVRRGLVTWNSWQHVPPRFDMPVWWWRRNSGMELRLTQKGYRIRTGHLSRPRSRSWY